MHAGQGCVDVSFDLISAIYFDFIQPHAHCAISFVEIFVDHASKFDSFVDMGEDLVLTDECDIDTEDAD